MKSESVRGFLVGYIMRVNYMGAFEEVCNVILQFVPVSCSYACIMSCSPPTSL